MKMHLTSNAVHCHAVEANDALEWMDAVERLGVKIVLVLQDLFHIRLRRVSSGQCMIRQIKLPLGNPIGLGEHKGCWIGMAKATTSDRMD